MNTAALKIWRRFHWSFFSNTQGLIVSLGRFQVALDRQDILLARIELDAATQLLRSSAAAMELAGSFTRGEYEEKVRPSMVRPAIEVDNFSGVMSWDHATLIQLWRRLRITFENLPVELRKEHVGFTAAYRELAGSHRSVCSKFGGDEGGSIRHTNEIAVDVLDRFEKNRSGIIGCPYH